MRDYDKNAGIIVNSRNQQIGNRSSRELMVSLVRSNPTTSKISYARQYLLSHGISPHYHRRETFSLLSSRWIQVVPICYCRRANRLIQHHLRTSGSENKLVVKVRYALVNIQTLEQFECYMVKPHGQLVRVSLMHYCTSTSRLSTL